DRSSQSRLTAPARSAPPRAGAVGDAALPLADGMAPECRDGGVCRPPRRAGVPQPAPCQRISLLQILSRRQKGARSHGPLLGGGTGAGFDCTGAGADCAGAGTGCAGGGKVATLLAMALVCAVISAPIVLSSTASRWEIESTFAFTDSNFTPSAVSNPSTLAA